ncbi:MAG: hypothetical protein QME96_17640, partial [Myxococcota bacterium]|nr:hypothetical protein [Myxococcota bacterium]
MPRSSGPFVAVVACAAGHAATARATTFENTAAACRDGLDNDADGHVDCADQDCWEFVFCRPAVPPAPTAPAAPAALPPPPSLAPLPAGAGP